MESPRPGDRNFRTQTLTSSLRGEENRPNPDLIRSIKTGVAPVATTHTCGRQRIKLCGDVHHNARVGERPEFEDRDSHLGVHRDKCVCLQLCCCRSVCDPAAVVEIRDLERKVRKANCRVWEQGENGSVQTDVALLKLPVVVDGCAVDLYKIRSFVVQSMHQMADGCPTEIGCCLQTRVIVEI